MVIFRYEWRRNRTYILVWAAALAAAIFCMTPVYCGMVGSVDALPAAIVESGFLKVVGVSLALLAQPLGMYAFLTGFLMNAGGVFGMHLGLCLYTKECTEHTAEYLFTKPLGRAAIFRGKALCMLCGVAVVGAFYLPASLLTMGLFYPGFAVRELLLIALSFPLHALFFGALGLLAGVCRPRSRSPLLTAGLTVFSEYIITAFARTVGSRPLSFLSPFSFFNPSEIHARGFYEADYLLWYLLVMAVFFALARRVLLRRDIALAA